jgi:hypothetical protein
MKKGYQHALKILLDEYKRLMADPDSSSKEKAQSVREGIEYLCYPYREDLSKFVRSPLRDEDNPEEDFTRADLSTPEKRAAFEDRMVEGVNRDFALSVVAQKTLTFLKDN